MNTPVSTRSLPAQAVAAAEREPLCPQCNGSLLQMPRRPIDRFVSTFFPVRRYRCRGVGHDPTCSWQGNLRGRSTDHGGLFGDLSSGMEKAKGWITPKTGKFLRVPGRSIAARRKGTRVPPIASFADVSFEEMAQITLDAIGDGVLVIDPQGTVIYVNRVAESLTGWASSKALGRPVEDVFFIVDGNSRQRAVCPARRAISEGRIVDLALGSVLVRRDGVDMAIEDSAAPIYNRRGKIAGAVIVFHDARQSQSAIQEMSYLAQHDFLTGLPNRVLLLERLTQAIGLAHRHHKRISVLFLDLDYFKQINDTFGHTAGDNLLRVIAADIVDCVRATDTVTRHGGDEFVILLTEIEESQDAARVAEKLLSRFSTARIVDGHEFQLTLSIGISVYPEDGDDGDTLMWHADSAMYSAKAIGRNNYQFCHPAQQHSNATCDFPQ